MIDPEETKVNVDSRILKRMALAMEFKENHYYNRNSEATKESFQEYVDYSRSLPRDETGKHLGWKQVNAILKRD